MGASIYSPFGEQGDRIPGTEGKRKIPKEKLTSLLSPPASAQSANSCSTLNGATSPSLGSPPPSFSEESADVASDDILSVRHVDLEECCLCDGCE